MPNEITNAWLVNMHNNQAHRLRTDDTHIGRGVHNDLVVPDPTVSRDHALIRYQSQQFYIYDRGARVPIYINGNRITTTTRLMNNDEILIGETTYRFTTVE